MKRFIVSVLAAFMVFAVTASASADFSKTTLVLVIYNPDDTEVAYDLGEIGALNFGAQHQISRAADGNFMADFTATAGIGDLSVGIFAAEQSTYTTIFGTTAPVHGNDTPIANIVGFQNAANALYLDYGFLSVGGKYTGESTNYFNAKMNNQGNAPGYYAGVNTANMNEGVGRFDANGVVDLYLYQFVGDLYEADYTRKVTGTNSEYIAHIQVHPDGQVILLPVPGAIVMLASGLIGIVGIRRKKQVETTAL